MPVLTIISHLNKFCVQKPGGYFELPKLSDSNYCVLCNNGCQCFGPSCKGLKPPTDRTVRSVKVHTTSSLLPGLKKESSSSSTSPLTKRESTHSKKIHISGSPYRPDSYIFNWHGRQNTPPVSISREETVMKSTHKKQQKREQQKSWYESLK